MKFDKQKAFPYPVLRPYSDDYTDAEFQTIVDFEISDGRVKAKISYALSSEEIIEQIEDGNAEYVSVISCRDTYRREVLKTKNTGTSVVFDIGDLRGEVKVDTYVFVCKKIQDFTSPDINSEFGDGPFEFNIGEVLAQDESQVFYIDRDMFKPVSSVFELVKKDTLSGGEWSIGFDENHIQIGVSQDMKGKIDSARNTTENRAILLNSIYFAAVMQAIQKLKDAPSEFDEYKWAEVFNKQAHNQGLDLSKHDACSSAQKLMQYPLSALGLHVFTEK